MPRPEVSELAEAYYQALGFHTGYDEANQWALLHFCSAWVGPLEPVYELVRERDDGTPSWGILFDVDECPAPRLPYLAQYPGCVLTPEMSEEQIRNEIREPTGWTRGRVPSIEVVARRGLTGTQRVIIRERTPEPGFIYIRTLATETLSEDRTRADLRAAVPAWSVLDYEAFDGLTYADLDAAYTTYAEVDADFASYDELLESSLP